MKKIIFILSIIAASWQYTIAQTATDALRFSYFEVGGTARTVGVGGALSAFGTDFSTIGINPAGLGMYRKSEFVITPSLLIVDTESVMEKGSNTPVSTDSKTNFNLNNFGVVISSRPRGSKWKTANFALGVNRIANFNQQFFYEGNSAGSVVDRFKELANAFEDLDAFESGLANDAGALLCCDADNLYVSDFDRAPDGTQIYRQEIVTTEGSINELIFGLAGNYDETFSVGGTIGLPFVSYTEERIYKEEDDGDGIDGNVPVFDDLEYRQNLTTTGIGLNLKLGFIYRPHQMFRVGFAAHTPTIYWLDDSYSSSLNYNYTDTDGIAYAGEATSPDGIFDYQLRTPWRLIGSAGVLVGKMGFISGEIEWADYSNSRFDLGQDVDVEQETNREINQTLGDAINARLGGELAIDRFRLRGGVGMMQSPLEGDDTINYSYSFGAGLRERSFYIDVAYKVSQIEESYSPYQTAEAAEQIVDNDIRRDKFMLTLGFRF